MNDFIHMLSYSLRKVKEREALQVSRVVVVEDMKNHKKSRRIVDQIPIVVYIQRSVYCKSTVFSVHGVCMCICSYGECIAA